VVTPDWPHAVAPSVFEQFGSDLARDYRASIDRFIQKRLAQEKLTPSPKADPHTLVRRLYLDLIGLPPTPAEADAFVNDPSPDAYSKLVDSLLASKHYGERWARRWLDLARYADTNGFEKDRSRSIWPFRDWVVKALNDDMGDFIKANGGEKDFTRWKVANTKLAMMAGELRQGGLKRALDQGEFNPQTVTGMLTSTNPQEAKLLYDNLNSAGRANARLLLLQSAAKKALDPNTGVINPNTFAREANRLRSNFGQFFSGAEAKRVNGLVAVLNATRRAQESQFAPRTGERLVPFATAGSFGWLGTLLGFDPLTGLASSAGVGAAARLYESAATRDMLMRIGKASGSEKARLISDFTQRMTAAAAPVVAVGAANLNEQPGPPEGAIIVGPKQ
jgi:hypothetical protein